MTTRTPDNFKTLSPAILVGLLGDIAATAQQITCLQFKPMGRFTVTRTRLACFWTQLVHLPSGWAGSLYRHW